MPNQPFVRTTILRYAPDVDDAPYWQTYEVPQEPAMRVLDVLERIVEDQGVSLAYRWFCGVMKCGMCAVHVNGKPVLACWEPAEAEMRIEPLPNHTVVRDLVVDRTEFDGIIQELSPLLARSMPYPGFPEPLTSTQMAGAAEMMNCIECLLCTSVCPAYGEGFAGPAALVQLAKVALDPRDSQDRATDANDTGQIADCVSCYQCTQACPTHIHVLEHAIDGLRKQMTERGIGEVAHHNQVYRDLTVQQGLVNPVALMVRSKGWRVIFELPQAIRLFMVGRLTVKSLFDGLLNRKPLPHVQDISKLAKAIQKEEQ
jgi:fumarate reductase (CoM/CoB) subunit B